MTATVNLKNGTSIVFDPIKETAHCGKAVLLSLQGRSQGETLTCALIPISEVGAVIASLELVARSLHLKP